MINILVGFSKEDREKFFKQIKISGDRKVLFGVSKGEILNNFSAKSFFQTKEKETFLFFDSIPALLEFDKSEAEIFDTEERDVFFIENTLLVSTTKELNKVFKDLEVIKNEKSGSKSNFMQSEASPFGVVDAFFGSKRQVAWAKFLSFVDEGGKAEELPSVLLWQAKSAMLAGTESLKSSGLAPFVYQKSGSIFKRLGQEALENKLQELAMLVYDVRFSKNKEEEVEMYILKNGEK